LIYHGINETQTSHVCLLEYNKTLRLRKVALEHGLRLKKIENMNLKYLLDIALE